jgi:hypothetical protein
MDPIFSLIMLKMLWVCLIIWLEGEEISQLSKVVSKECHLNKLEVMQIITKELDDSLLVATPLNNSRTINQADNNLREIITIQV